MKGLRADPKRLKAPSSSLSRARLKGSGWAAYWDGSKGGAILKCENHAPDGLPFRMLSLHARRSYAELKRGMIGKVQVYLRYQKISPARIDLVVQFNTERQMVGNIVKPTGIHDAGELVAPVDT